MDDDISGEVEDLFRALFDAAQTRRFVRRFAGEDVARRLPERGATGEQVLHEAARLLCREGRIDDAFFARIAVERPGRVRRVSEAALACGCEPVSPGDAAAGALHAEVPEHVVVDLYESLKEQQRLVHDFIGGPWARLDAARSASVGTTTDELKAAAAEVQAWVRAHMARFHVDDVRVALGGISGEAPSNPTVDPLLFLRALLDGEGRARRHIWLKTIQYFSLLTPPQLYRLARALSVKVDRD